MTDGAPGDDRLSVLPAITPWTDYEGLIASVLEHGAQRNPCPDHCHDRDRRHDHLRDEGGDFIVFADGTWSGFDLTQPARLIYPAPGRR